MKTKSVKRQSKFKSQKGRFEEGIELWTSYYRANISRFIQDYLEINIFWFQAIVLHLFHLKQFSFFVGSRGLGKTFLTSLYCCAVAILYPETKIVVASYSRSQASMLIKKVEKELMIKSPNLRREIKEIKTGINDSQITFHNGSTVVAVVSGESARGHRANILIIDESRLVKKEIYDSILRPMLTVTRLPKYFNKTEYSDYPREENKEIFLTSAYYKSDKEFEKFKGFVGNTLKGLSYSVFNFGCELALHHGLLTQARVDAIRNEPDMNLASFMMEMYSIWYGQNDKAFFQSEDINNNRKIVEAWYPPTETEWLNEKNKSKKSYTLQKQNGELRILSADIAVMGSNKSKHKNDNTVFTLFRLLPKGDSYIRQVVYQETMEGGHSEYQSLRIKEIFYDFECDYIALDIIGVGLSILDNLMSVQFNERRGVEYPAFGCMNDDSLNERAGYKDVLKVIFAVRGTAQLNHEIALGVKDDFQNGKLKLLINDLEGKDYLIEHKKLLSKTPQEQARLLLPYVQTTSMINEMINLEYYIHNGYIKLYEKSNNRKDRYSSLSYGNYLAKHLEIKLKKPDKKNNGFISFW